MKIRFFKHSPGMFTAFQFTCRWLGFGVALSLEDFGTWRDDAGQYYLAALNYKRFCGAHCLTVSLWALAVTVLVGKAA